jgi:hypothetical protein
MNTIIEKTRCTYCGDKLDEEEIETPSKDGAGMNAGMITMSSPVVCVRITSMLMCSIIILLSNVWHREITGM